MLTGAAATPARTRRTCGRFCVTFSALSRRILVGFLSGKGPLGPAACPRTFRPSWEGKLWRLLGYSISAARRAAALMEVSEDYRKVAWRPGMAEIRAFVYSSTGLARTSEASPISTSLPDCITATRSEICWTTARSCEMKR